MSLKWDFWVDVASFINLHYPRHCLCRSLFNSSIILFRYFSIFSIPDLFSVCVSFSFLHFYCYFVIRVLHLQLSACKFNFSIILFFWFCIYTHEGITFIFHWVKCQRTQFDDLFVVWENKGFFSVLSTGKDWIFVTISLWGFCLLQLNFISFVLKSSYEKKNLATIGTTNMKICFHLFHSHLKIITYLFIFLLITFTTTILAQQKWLDVLFHLNFFLLICFS